jgi:hypothetical protein
VLLIVRHLRAHFAAHDVMMLVHKAALQTLSLLRADAVVDTP